MKVLVLGSCEGGASPAAAASTTTQPAHRGVAVSVDGDGWLLLNASPDLGHQIRTNPRLCGAAGAADSPLKGVVLMDGQIEHVAGLLSLRDGPPLQLYATPCVFEDLSSGLPLLPALEHYCGVHWHMVPVAGEVRVAPFRVAGFERLQFTAIATRGPAPAYATYRDDSTVGANIALFIEDLLSGQSFFYSPGPASLGEAELMWMRRADCLLLDASIDALNDAAPSPAASAPSGLPGRAAEPSDTLLQALRGMPNRKVLSQLWPRTGASDERADPAAAWPRDGIELAHDGMEIEL